RSVVPPTLHSFPTRRSSDLVRRILPRTESHPQARGDSDEVRLIEERVRTCVLDGDDPGRIAPGAPPGARGSRFHDHLPGIDEVQRAAHSEMTRAPTRVILRSEATKDPMKVA